MAKRKIPKTSITTKQLLDADSLGAYLEQKMRQLGVSKDVTAKAMLYTSGIMISNQTGGTRNGNGFPTDRIENLIVFFDTKHKELGLEPYGDEEKNHLRELNSELRKPKTFTSRYGKINSPDLSVTEDALLQTKHLGDYIALKSQQMGLASRDISDSIGNEKAYLKLRNRKQTCQFEPEVFERLVSLITEKSKDIKGLGCFSSAEEAHMRALHSALDAFVPIVGKKEKELPAANTKDYDIGIILPGYKKKFVSTAHVLPSAAMLEALDKGQHEQWNALKEALLKEPGNDKKRVYLRGFNAQHKCLMNFDLSKCDMIGFIWPTSPPNTNGIASLKDSVLIGDGPLRQVEDKYFSLHMPIKAVYERDNPNGKLGQPQPANAVNEMTNEATLAQASIRGK